MKDLNYVLRKAYYDRLNNVVVDSSPIPFYDTVPTTASEPYMYVSDFTSFDRGDKSTFGQEATITLVVVTKQGNTEGGRKSSDDIANKIIEEIRTRSANYLTLGNDHYIITTTLDNTSSFIESVEGGKLVIRSIRFRHITSEN